MSSLDGTWGYASADMYTNRWALIEPNLGESDFVLVDWGSDAGWFSLAVAKAFPLSSVISVEAGIMSDGQGLRMHGDKMKAYGVENNVIVDCVFGPATFEALQAVPADYQLVLSVFHHMGNVFGTQLNRIEEWNDAFCDLLRGANVTFFEVPNEDNPGETPHKIREWYGDRNLETIIQSAMQHGGVSASVELLGEIEHGAKGTRKLFKISLMEPAEPATAQAIEAHIRSASRLLKIPAYSRFRMTVSRFLRQFRNDRTPLVREHLSEKLPK